jgi:hypothetical protein
MAGGPRRGAEPGAADPSPAQRMQSRAQARPRRAVEADTTSKPVVARQVARSAAGPDLAWLHSQTRCCVAPCPQGSLGSESNGALMRCSPLGVWGWRLSDEAGP